MRDLGRLGACPPGKCLKKFCPAPQLPLASSQGWKAEPLTSSRTRHPLTLPCLVAVTGQGASANAFEPEELRRGEATASQRLRGELSHCAGAPAPLPVVQSFVAGVDLAGDVRCAGTSSTSPPCMILYLKLVRLPSGTACVHHATSMCSCVALSHARKTIERVSVIGTIVRWSPCTCPPPALLRTLGGALRGRARTGPGPATSPRSR